MSTPSDLRDNVVSALLVSPHFTVRTAMPLLLAGLAQAYGYREAALGALGSAYSVGSLVAALAALWWADRMLRLPVVIGMLIGTLGLVVVLYAASYGGVFAGFLLAGIGFGGVYSWMLSWLVVAAQPSRTLAWQWGVGTLPGMAFLYLIPGLGAGAAGVRQTFLAVLLANLLAGAAALYLPRQWHALATRPRAAAASAAVRAAPQAPAVYLAAAALLAIYAGCTGGWSLLARLAHHDGLEPGFAGLALSFATAASCVVAVLLMRWGDRGGRTAFMAWGVASMMAGLGCVGWLPGRAGFALGTLLFISLSAYVLTYCGGLIARRARGARSAGLSAIALGAGAILGPAAAGYLYQVGGPRLMLWCAALTLAAGLMAYARANRMRPEDHLSA